MHQHGPGNHTHLTHWLSLMEPDTPAPNFFCPVVFTNYFDLCKRKMHQNKRHGPFTHIPKIRQWWLPLDEIALSAAVCRSTFAEGVAFRPGESIDCFGCLLMPRFLAQIILMRESETQKNNQEGKALNRLTTIVVNHSELLIQSLWPHHLINLSWKQPPTRAQLSRINKYLWKMGACQA